MAHEPFDIIGVPLVEASIEVRFPGDARIEALRGDFQQAVRQECPHLLVPKYREGEAPALAPHVYRSDGGKRTIALAIHMLAYSTQDYPGWQAFLGRYLRYWSLLEAWIAPKESTRVGLRYVNRLDGETRRHLRHSDPPPFLVPLREPVARHHGTSTISAEGHELDVTVHYDGEEELTIDFDAHVEGVHGARLETTLKRLHVAVESVLADTVDETYATGLGLASAEGHRCSRFDVTGGMASPSSMRRRGRVSSRPIDAPASRSRPLLGKAWRRKQLTIVRA